MALGFDLGHLSPIPLMVGALAVAGVAALLADGWRARSPRTRVAARLDNLILRGAASASDAEAASDLALFSERAKGLRGGVSRQLADLGASLGGPKALAQVALVAAAAAVGTAVAARSAAGLGAPTAAAVGFAGGFVGWRLMAGELRRRWALAFLDQMVEAIELMTRSVRSGFTPGAAIRIVSQEVAAPCGPVFARIADEDELGLDLRTSLRRASRQVGLADFNFLAVALILQRETGGQLAETLESLHLMLRKRREARLKIMALTSEGRMSATILAALPFVAGLGVWFVNPAHFALLFTPGLGQSMLAVGGAMLATGVLVMRWMVTARP